MGIFDGYELASYDSPEMSKALALMTAAQVLGAPLAPGESLGTRIPGALGGGLMAYLKHKQEADKMLLDAEESKAKNRYRDMLTKELEAKIAEPNKIASVMDTPVDTTEQVPLDAEEAGWDLFDSETPGSKRTVQKPYWQTLKNGALIKSALMQKVSLPAALLSQDEETPVDIMGKKVNLSDKDLIRYYLGLQGNETRQQIAAANNASREKIQTMPQRPKGAGSGGAGSGKKTTSTDQYQIAKEVLTAYATDPDTRVRSNKDLSKVIGSMSDRQKVAFKKIYDDAVSIFNAGAGRLTHNKSAQMAIDNYWKNKGQTPPATQKTAVGQRPPLATFHQQ